MDSPDKSIRPGRSSAMFRLSLIPLLTVSFAAATPQEEIDVKSPAALKLLDTWQKTAPVRADRKVHIVYWTPSDREPAPQFRERLTPIMEHIRTFYGKEMAHLGLGTRTFSLDHEKDGQLKIHVIRGLQPYAHYEVKSGGEIRKECEPGLKAAGIDVENETIVLFCNMSNWDPQTRTISQNSPYYASGTNRRGTAWQVDSPILDLKQLGNKGDNVKDGQYGNISIGRYNSIFIGGIAHELGHALGLPHNKECTAERAAFGTALMGSGNRSYGEELRGESKGSFLNLAHGLQLASHPLFTGSIKGWDAKLIAAPSLLNVKADGKTIVLSGTIKAEVPVYGVIAYADPDGGGDYDATTASAVPDQDGNFTLTCTDLVAGKKGELRLFFLQSNGMPSGFLSSTPFKYPYTVAADGTPDVSEITRKLPAPPAKP
jgi:hypothetical protein